MSTYEVQTEGGTYQVETADETPASGDNASNYWREKGDYPEAGAEKPSEQKLAENIQTVGSGMGIPYAIEGLYGLGKSAMRGLGKALPENIPETIGRVADNQMLKSTGASMGQIKQIGPEAAREAAEVGRNAGLGDVFSTDVGREKALEALDKTTGKTIGALREEAGPAPSGIPEKIAKELSTKYETGGSYSGEAGGVKKALEDIKRLSGEVSPDLPVVDPKTITGEPKALFAYNQPDLAGRGGPETSMYKVLGNHPNSGSQMTLSQLKEAGIPVIGREARSVGKWEPLDLTTPPTHAGYAKGATFLNDFATGNKLAQPVNAATDVANTLSRENNAGIVQSLGSDKGKKYLEALSNERAYKQLEQFFTRGELRDMAGRGGGKNMIQQMIQGLADKGGYRLTSKIADAIHKAMTQKTSLSGITNAAGTALKGVAPKVLGGKDKEIADYLRKQFQ